MKIGVFDSGLGGLYIFRKLLKYLPAYDYVYLGDNARVPYGGRSSELIYKFTKRAVDFLFHKNCQIVILACNTASANALKRLQRKYLPQNFPDRRILGIIIPTVEAAVEENFKKIGIIGTRATINSQSYPAELKKLAPEVEVYQKECPLLAPLIEEGELERGGLDLLIKKYLSALPLTELNGLILACTHYGLIGDQIKRNLPSGVKVVSQGEVVADKFRSYLARHPELEEKLDKNSQRTYYVTDLSQRYEDLMKLFLVNHFNNAKLELVNI